MLDSEKDAFIRKELQIVAVYLANLHMTPGWRLQTSASLASDARSSLRKVAALMGYSGQWWRDISLYLAAFLPIVIPINLALASTIFTVLNSFINGALSFVTMEPKVIQTTIKVPYWFFFSKSKTIDQTVLVPVVHPPHWAISPTIAVSMILVSLFAASWLLKRIWIHEICFRMNHLERTWSSRTQTCQKVEGDA